MPWTENGGQTWMWCWDCKPKPTHCWFFSLHFSASILPQETRAAQFAISTVVARNCVQLSLLLKWILTYQITYHILSLNDMVFSIPFQLLAKFWNSDHWDGMWLSRNIGLLGPQTWFTIYCGYHNTQTWKMMSWSVCKYNILVKSTQKFLHFCFIVFSYLKLIIQAWVNHSSSQILGSSPTSETLAQNQSWHLSTVEGICPCWFLK